MNHFVLYGRLSQEPKDMSKKKGKKGYSLSRFTIACDAYRNEEKTADFISCMAWGNLADVINEYCKKGDRICVSGHIQTGDYEDEDGETVYTQDLVVDKLDLVESKDESKKSKKKTKKKPVKKSRKDEDEDEDDDDEEDD